MTVRILIGDVRDVLKKLPSDSVDCCITSPPYWGLRSYLPAGHPKKQLEIGSEATVHEWVQTMVEVFREVRRVLKPAGTLWLNLGDSYAGGFRGGHSSNTSTLKGTQPNHSMVPSRRRDKEPMPRPDRAQPGLKPKDLVGQPWRVAFALQDDGWWLRQEIIWAKRSPMPESVRDRFTKAHEHVFLLAKSQNYFFDFDAVQEPASMGTHERAASTGVGFGRGFDEVQKPRAKHPHGWAQAQAGQHPKTPKDALATSGNDGAYADGKSERMGRGAGWRLAGNKTHKGVAAFEAGDVHHRTKGGLLGYDERQRRKLAEAGSGTKNNAGFDKAMAAMPATRNPRSVRWLASEPFRGAHFATYPPELIRPFVRAGCPVGGTVLDPFGGSGTTGLVADQEGRHAILIDIDERNGPMAEERIAGSAPLLAQVERSCDAA